MPTGSPIVIVTARNEAASLPATLAALREAFPEGRLVVADDGSTDGTGDLARQGGAELVRHSGRHGKGANATAAAQTLLDDLGAADAVVLCDADLGASAGRLAPLVAELGECDLAVAAFARPGPAGLGLTIGFARWAAHSLTGVELRAPLSGQRALRGGALRELLPFAPRYGMELAMSVDAMRAGHRLREVELDLAHRASGRGPRGFAHRGAQLRDCLAVYLSRRLRSRRAP